MAFPVEAFRALEEYHLGVHIHELLPLGARPALERALRARLSYTARYVVAPGPRPRAVVILGEAHVKLRGAAALGRTVVKCFDLRGVETFQTRDVFLGRALGLLIKGPRVVLRVVTLGLVKGSTITEAKAIETGHTEDLERAATVPLALHGASAYLAALFGFLYATFAIGLVGQVPRWLELVVFGFQIHSAFILPAYLLRRQSWAWCLHPAVALVTARDAIMAEGTVRMLREHEAADAAVVVMGRAHVVGYERELVENHGFTRAEL